MTEDLFNTPTEEVDRLVMELRETKDALRELSGKLTRIETRLKRVFPRAFPARQMGTKQKAASGQEPPTLTPESAIALYGELVELATKGQIEEVQRRLSSANLSDLSFLRRELGAPLGKKKPSPKTLIDSILGRIKESVMLSKHTNRRELLDHSNAQKGPSKEGGQE